MGILGNETQACDANALGNNIFFFLLLFLGIRVVLFISCGGEGDMA